MPFETLLNEGVPALQWGAALTAAAVATWTDLASRRIPNWLTLPVFVGGVLFAGIVGHAAGAGESLAAAAILAFPFVLLFVFAGGGAGDAKLMAAIGAWLGVSNGLVVLACVSLAGAALAVARLALRRPEHGVVATLAASLHGASVALRSGGDVRSTLGGAACARMPYAPAVLLGTLAAGMGVWLWNA
jgi:prepilin peptidase CpaA